MIDIDHFKRVNDAHGHDAGDQVLRACASRLARALPVGSFLARYGGEEFCALIDPSAGDVVEEARLQVGRDAVRHGKLSIPVTASAGVAEGPGKAIQELILSADQALYEAKASGRNRTVRASGVERSAKGRSIQSRRFRRVYPRPLIDLGWFGPRVVGLDAVAHRMVSIDFFGVAAPVGPELRDALSFVRIGQTAIWIPAEGPRILMRRVSGPGWEEAEPSAPADAAGLPELRRVSFDSRHRRLFWIERCGRAVYWSDLAVRSVHPLDINGASPETGAGGVTAVLPVGDRLIVLNALSRRLTWLDRQRFVHRKTRDLPVDGYEVCLSYLPSERSLLAGGGAGTKLLSFDGAVREEVDQPIISAYAHPVVGLVVSTPDETVLVG